MYAVTVRPFVRRTRAILRMAELGFLGLVVNILMQTPFTNGQPSSAGVRLTGGRCGRRAPRIACCSVTCQAGVVEIVRTGASGMKLYRIISDTLIIGLRTCGVHTPRPARRSAAHMLQ